MLKFSQKELDGVVILSLEGRLDALTANEFRPTIDQLEQDRKLSAIFDLEKLQMIDSSGVGAIVSLFKRLRKIGGDVKIARLTGQPKEIFRLLRLDRAFDIFETVEEAVSRFRQ
ncbi:MAG: STAS domain-containing protein [Pseudomonadota bacterium]